MGGGGRGRGGVAQFEPSQQALLFHLVPNARTVVNFVKINPHLRGHGTMSLYNTPSFVYKNSETICIPSPRHCLYTHVFKFMKQVFKYIF